MIWSESRDVLRSHGMRVEVRDYGLEGWSDAACGRQMFQAGGSHQRFGGELGVELSVWQVGADGRSPVAGVDWFYRATVRALTDLLLDAHLRVLAGAATTLRDALRQIDQSDAAPSR